MQKRQIKAPYGNIAYWASHDFDRKRKTLFFLHGLMADHTMFGPQIAFFGEKFNIIAWDAPAHGQSRPYGSLNYKRAAGDIKQILDECGISKVIFDRAINGRVYCTSFYLQISSFCKRIYCDRFLSIRRLLFQMGYSPASPNGMDIKALSGKAVKILHNIANRLYKGRAGKHTGDA